MATSSTQARPPIITYSLIDSPGKSCKDFALEGERRCCSGDAENGIKLLKTALTVGTDDLSLLHAIYGQLGSAYFALADYTKAHEYHRYDLILSRTIGDKCGEAMACGNLANAFKAIGKFNEGAMFCRRDLHLSRLMDDEVGQGRALYNLGTVYLGLGRQEGRLHSGEHQAIPQEVRTLLWKALFCFEKSLEVVQNCSDRIAIGRAYGSIGNTHFALGNFSEAVAAHKLRFQIAKEDGDKPAMRRAFANLRRAYAVLGIFDPEDENCSCFDSAVRSESVSSADPAASLVTGVAESFMRKVGRCTSV